MYCTIRFTALSAVLILALAGCKSHQAKVDALQKEYDQLGAQFQKDCTAEYLKVPPTLSQKCADEKAKLEAVGKQLQSERTKQ
jgi:uncharacterized protein HemX